MASRRVRLVWTDVGYTGKLATSRDLGIIIGTAGGHRTS
jgi:hypothetical protein